MEQAIAAALEAIYDAAPDPTRWPQALQSIADCFGDVGTVLLWQRDDGSFGTIVSPKLETAQRDYVEHGWNLRDLPAIRAVERGLWLRTDAVSDRDAVSDKEIASDPFYTEFMARHGLRWRAAIGVAPDRHVAAAISVQRSASKPPFSDSELETATRLGRHVEKSLRLSIRLLDAELVNVGLGDALNRLSIGVFALDSLGRVVFSNPAGERLLDDGITLLNDRLVISALPERVALATAIERADQRDFAHQPKPILIHRQKVENPLVIYALPIATSPHPALQFLTHARVIVLLIDPVIGMPPDPALVRDVLGLTLGEARVAALVGSGFPPREAAQQLRITEETARTVLKRVLKKTGLERQSELTALLTKLMLR